MRTVNIEFPYFYEVIGQEVVVEVEAILYKGSPAAESDWDVQDYLEIVQTEVFLDGDTVIDVDIPLSIIYSEISAQIRDAEITSAFSEEDGGY